MRKYRKYLTTPRLKKQKRVRKWKGLTLTLLLYMKGGDREMNGSCKNIYFNARKHAGIAREEAADRLYISTRSLAAYETNETIPPCGVVCSMVELYQNKQLGYLHLKHSTEVGKKYLPDLHLTDLPMSVIRLQKEVDDLQRIRSEMLSIVCDGQIEKHEQKAWQSVLKEVNEVASAAMAMQFSGVS